MKHFQYCYKCDTRFSRAVNMHFFHLRCVPCMNECQLPQNSLLVVSPRESLSYATDAWGNAIQYGSLLEPHNRFTYMSTGTVAVMPYLIPARQAEGVYCIPSTLTACDGALVEAARSIAVCGSPLYQALELSALVFGQMVYSPNSTVNATTAAQAFAQHQGVCQDYAHILLALCRQRGLAVRYVNGFIPGEGQTHAWIEVWNQGAWHGIDPTHNRLIDTGYIKIAHGRDAADCPVNRGVFRGVAEQQTCIQVTVKEI